VNKVHSISTTARQLLAATAISALAVLLLGAGQTHAQAANYSYTVQEGDGVTNLILDLAETNDKDISVARAYAIAQDNGQTFLDNNLTVESELPYTDGIGAFEDAGVTITASDNQDLFDSLTAAINDSPDAEEDDVEVPEEDSPSEATADSGSDDKQSEDSDSADKDADNNAEDTEGDDESNEDDADDNIWPWVIGIAAVLGALYYINSSRDES